MTGFSAKTRIVCTLAACLALAAQAPRARLSAAPLPAADEIKLTPIAYDDLLKTIASKNKGKYTVVDAWATWCSACKENFPHLVEMHAKYGDQGVATISLSLDDSTNKKALAEALKFLKEKKAEFPNYVLTENQDDAFEKLNVNGLPAVFVYGPDGKEIARFTYDDPNHQFEYPDVEKLIVEKLKKKN